MARRAALRRLRIEKRQIAGFAIDGERADCRRALVDGIQELLIGMKRQKRRATRLTRQLGFGQ